MLRLCKRFTSALLIIAPLVFILSTANDASAQEAKPIQLSVFNPVQLVPANESVAGLRLSLFHSRNHNVTGFDWVWIGLHQTTGNFVGVAWTGLSLSIVDGTMTGWQATLGNIAQGGMTGAQTGVFNLSGGEATGFAFGAVNISDSFTGLQIGVVNITRRMRGVQIGLVNIIKEGKLPVMVIANASF